MKYIQFNETKYEIRFDYHHTATRFSVIIAKGDNTVDDILEDVSSPETIKIYEDDELIAVYNDFHHLFAMTLIASELTGEFNTVNLEYTQEYETVLTDMQNQINDLEDSQATQDLAIEDLAEAVSELEEG